MTQGAREWLALLVFLFSGMLVGYMVGRQSAFEQVEREAPPDPVIVIGTEEDCMVEIPVAVWPELNHMHVYRWVVACEDKKELEP